MSRVLACLILCAAAAAHAAAKEAPVPKVQRAASPIRSLALFDAPEGWGSREMRIMTEPVISFSSAPYEIRVRLFGGEDSRFRTRKEFMTSFEARSELKYPPSFVKRIRLSGRRAVLYSRRYVLEGSPARERPELQGREQRYFEQFVLLPAGEKFLVLSCVAEETGEAFDKRGDKAWRKFLRGFALRRKPAKQQPRSP